LPITGYWFFLYFCLILACAPPQPAPHRGETLIWKKLGIAERHPKLPYFSRAFFLIWEEKVIRSKLKLSFA
jgi:hypothetical protein